MPKYAKFLKDLLTNKNNLEEACSIILNENCSGNVVTSQVSNDLVENVNLISYSFYSKLYFSDSKPIQMMIHLAEKRITFPQGIVEDLLVKVDNFVFSADFVVIDMEEDN